MNLKKAILTTLVISITNFSYSQENYKNPIKKNVELSDQQLQNWHHKDYQQDTLPGVSLEKLYKSGLLDSYKKTQEIIVAVIDTKIDIDHIDLKGQLWVNEDEIANNGKDDDNNGYIDDMVGWDFLGNTKGEYIKYQSAEVVRIIQKFRDKFEAKEETEIDSKELANYKLYVKAKKALEEDITGLKNPISFFNEWLNSYATASAKIKEITKKEDINIDVLNSVLNSNKDSIIVKHANFLKTAIENNQTEATYKHYSKWYTDMLTTTYNVDYKERTITGDNPDDITDVNYGYNTVSGEVPFNHSIVVSGVIGANRDNNLGAMGFSKNIKVMPIVMVASGDEHDKDIALAVRYAVDNGARVINMSWGKKFSLHQNWVLDAIKYAESKNVLIVHGAGNDATNSDKLKYYPNDYHSDLDAELVSNFITVGASGYKLDENIIASFSNYGKKSVDVFAPGLKVYTTKEYSKFGFSRGTSLAAPMVSGLAGLLLTHFPELSAKDLKKIIMESGNTFDIPVNVMDNGDKKSISFKELSKSGKIINAYNAFLMAAKQSKN